MQGTAIDLREWVQLIRAEYLEMPCLRLSRPQAARLWNLDAATCEALLEELVAGKFLHRTPDGFYVRSSSCPPTS